MNIRTIASSNEAEVIEITSAKNRSICTVERRRRWGQPTWDKASVNWSAWGNADIAEADEFAAGLTYGVSIARTMDIKSAEQNEADNAGK